MKLKSILKSVFRDIRASPKARSVDGICVPCVVPTGDAHSRICADRYEHGIL